MIEVRNRHAPESADELMPLQLEQLYIVGKRFDGEDRSAELRFVDQPVEADDDDDDVWDDGNLAAHALQRWDVYVDGVHRYDLWVHHGDSGCLFVTGTTTDVAGRFQSTWLQPDAVTPFADADALDDAMLAVGAW